MSEIEQELPLPLEEQVSLELVKHNYTEAKLNEFDEYLKLDIVDDDKESYLIIKDKRKEVKSYRVAVEKFCKFKREDAVKIQKVWVSNENKLVERLSKVEDHLEAKEKGYEKKIAEEKEARKRKQEEQLIVRQQALAAMGVLYADGNFSMGEVSFEFSAIKESEEDVWQEAILPKFKEEYEKTQAEQIEQQRREQEKADNLKRQQEELEQKQKELAQKEADLKLEADRQAEEARKAREARDLARTDQLLSLGLKFDFVDHFKGYDCFVPMLDLRFHNDEKWSKLIEEVTEQVNRKKEAEAEEERKEKDRNDLQKARFTEMYPYEHFGGAIDMMMLWKFDEEAYQKVLSEKKEALTRAQEEKDKAIAEEAAKKERERIEEEQRKAEVKRKKELIDSRTAFLVENSLVYLGESTLLGEMSEDIWMIKVNELKYNRDEKLKKEEAEKKAEMFAQASDKMKWTEMLTKLKEIEIYDMRSGQYRKKAAILREKLEEIKAL